tara:strand:- start:62 stop:316 length:255 start_codon:yes stop_codon:yes gene_type:complete
MRKPKTIALTPQDIELLQGGRNIEWAETVVRVIVSAESTETESDKHVISVGAEDLQKLREGARLAFGTCTLMLDGPSLDRGTEA